MLKDDVAKNKGLAKDPCSTSKVTRIFKINSVMLSRGHPTGKECCSDTRDSFTAIEKKIRH